MNELVQVFMPSLVSVLLRAEDHKGAPLTPEEAFEIRDKAAVVMMRPAVADEISTTRGYLDIDPENLWYDWQMLRRELGREPELDPGARVLFHSRSDDDVQAAEAAARASLGEFKNLVERHGVAAMPTVKLFVEEPGYRGGLWLLVTAVRSTDFDAEFFEIPPGLEAHRVGETRRVDHSEVCDWMVNLDGSLFGGFTLRLHRESLREEDRVQFDRHLGVTRYV